jgi:hypothetical protein
MVKVKMSSFFLLSVVLCVFIFTPCIYADQPLPPSSLAAISDQDGKIPLFWFKPIPDTSELAYDDGLMDHHIYVFPEWHHNCFAVKMTSTEVPFYLLKSKVFISYEGSETNSNYNFEAPFFITVNLDSGGIPKNTFLDSVSAHATGTDTLEADGEWVEVEHNLLVRGDSSETDSLNFWIVFHWMEETPLSPLVGGDDSLNQKRSFWGMKNSPHFEWHERSDYNIMIRTVIGTNGGDSCEVDSFKIYRSDSSFSISDTNLIGSVPFDQFLYIDTNVNNDQTYFYEVTSLNSGDESEESNEASATPKKGAVLVTDPNFFNVNLSSEEKVFEELTLTNSGGLPLEFEIQIDMEEQSWMGGSDEFGYTWTDKNLEGGFGYSWVDIRDFEEEIGGSGDDNENYGFFSLGFPFPFYGNIFDSLCISANGWISFTDEMDSILACYVNKPLPYLWGPYNLVATLWDDLKLTDSSKIYFHANDDSAFICFMNLFRYSPSIGGGPYTFQTILTKDGEIAFQYHRVNDTLCSATVGIQNQDGTAGLEISYNQNYMEDSLWVKIRPSWVSVDSMQGTIQPGESKILNLTFNRLSYPRGIYHANLIINSRDKNHQLDPIGIPLTLCVDTTTSVEFEEDQKPVTFALFPNYPNPFNPVTCIRYAVGGRQKKAADNGLVLSEVEGRRTVDGSFARVTLKIYNILGQKVRTLVDEPKASGNYQVIWDGKDDQGKDVASGIYFYQLTAGDYKETKKMTLVR